MDERDREWWQHCAEDVIRAKLAQMSMDQLHELNSDMSNLIVKLSAQRQQGSPDRDWLNRVKYAEAMSVARRKLVKAELQSRGENARTRNHERRRRWVAKARAALDAGDVAGAVRLLVDSYDPDRSEQT